MFIEKTKARLDGTIPLFTSDQLFHYCDALVNSYHVVETYPRTGKRGRPRKPKIVPHPDLEYAQVVKHRRKGRVIKVSRRIIFGNEERIYTKASLLITKDGNQGNINTSYVERNNLTMRQNNKRLSRKTLAFSKNKDEFQNQMTFYCAYFDFVRTHDGLKLRTNEIAPRGVPRKWLKRTPAMSAGITDHVWTLRELLTYRVSRE